MSLKPETQYKDQLESASAPRVPTIELFPSAIFPGIEIPTLYNPTTNGEYQLICPKNSWRPDYWSTVFVKSLADNFSHSIRPLSNKGSPRRMLEVGVGIGTVLAFLNAISINGIARAVGLDVNEHSVTVANENFHNLGLPHHAQVSNLLSDYIGPKVHTIIACIPQVEIKNPENGFENSMDSGNYYVWEQALQIILSERGVNTALASQLAHFDDLSQVNLTDLAGQGLDQNTLESIFKYKKLNLGLLVALLEQSKGHLVAGGEVILNIGGRPGEKAIRGMFEFCGYEFDEAKDVVSMLVPQDPNTDITEMIRQAAAYESSNGAEGHPFEFFVKEEKTNGATEIVVSPLKGQVLTNVAQELQAAAGDQEEIAGIIKKYQISHNLYAIRARLKKTLVE